MVLRVAIDGTGPLATQTGPYRFWTVINDGASAMTIRLDAVDHVLEAGETFEATDGQEVLHTFEVVSTVAFRFFAVIP